MANTLEFNALFQTAHNAGMAAVNGFTPVPMVIRDANVITGVPLANGRSYFVESGVCGFAWVHIKGNTAFGRWAKKAGYARSAYHSGLDISCREFGQSMQRKEVYTNAFAKILNDNGIAAWPDSRMD